MNRCTPEPAVLLRGVSAGYGARTVLHGVDAEIPAHRVTALVGLNGSGKSTLLSVLAGIHPPSSGTVERAHGPRPALVVQRSAVSDALPVTVRDTVAMGRWAHLGPWRRATSRDRRIVADCMDRMGVAHLADRPLGSLSGGQRQRALLAQGLAQQSDLLLLDEPGTGLDSSARQAVLDLLDAARSTGDGGTTVVHATHDPDAADRADHRIHLRDGRPIVESGPRPVPASGGRIGP